MVGVHMIRLFPTERLDCRIRLGAQTGRFGADERVFAVRFVPDGYDVRAEFSGQDTRAKLRFALVRKTVAHAE